MNRVILGFLSLSILNTADAQYSNLDIKIDNYSFATKFDESNYTTQITIKNGSRVIFTGSSDYAVIDIKQYDLDDNGTNEILLNLYSGGAHCCFYLVAGNLNKNKFTILDSLYWGNSSYEIVDLNNDGRHEIVGYNDMFAYAFTNYAESRFSIMAYEFKNDKFANVTKKFPGIINDNLAELKQQLYSITDTGFKCENYSDETFNTEAGAVKAILAPIVDDYYNLGEVRKGYELIDSVYKCEDREKFVQILQNEYKLK